MSKIDRELVRRSAVKAQEKLDGAVGDLVEALTGLDPGSILAREIEANIDDCIKARRGLYYAAREEMP